MDWFVGPSHSATSDNVVQFPADIADVKFGRSSGRQSIDSRPWQFPANIMSPRLRSTADNSFSLG